MSTELEELLQTCLSEEKECQFPTLSRKDVWTLGTILVEYAKTAAKPVAAEIRVNGLTLFSYYPEGASPFYKMILDRKHQTAQVFEKSSLRFYAENQLNHVDPETAMCLDPAKYQFRGGGFPIRLKNGCIIGTIAVAGLDHTQDHALIVNSIQRFLKQ